MVTEEDVRRIALSLPETIESWMLKAPDRVLKAFLA